MGSLTEYLVFKIRKEARFLSFSFNFDLLKGY